MVIEKLYGCDQTLTGPFADLRFVHLPEKNVGIYWHILVSQWVTVGQKMEEYKATMMPFCMRCWIWRNRNFPRRNILPKFTARSQRGRCINALPEVKKVVAGGIVSFSVQLTAPKPSQNQGLKLVNHPGSVKRIRWFARFGSISGNSDYSHHLIDLSNRSFRN